MFDPERISRKRQTSGRDTGGKMFFSAINNQTVGGIDFMQEIFEGIRLQSVEKFPSFLRQSIHCRHDAKRRVLYARSDRPRVSERRAVAIGLGTQSSRLLLALAWRHISSRDDCVPRPVATARGSVTRGSIILLESMSDD